jgi:hypothetical protein
VDRSTVARAWASARPPKYERAVVSTVSTPFEPPVLQLLAEHPYCRPRKVTDDFGPVAFYLILLRELAILLEGDRYPQVRGQ